MEQFSTEEQQAEVIRKWIKENGPSIAIGIGLGLAVMFGINRWQAHTLGDAEAASMQYAAFQQTASQGERTQILAQADRLRKDHADSAYAVFAALSAAKSATTGAEPDYNAAEQELRWVIEHAKVSGLQQIARIRLARLLLSNGNPSAATAALRPSSDAASSTAFKALFAEVEGDIAVANGDVQHARESYTLALAGQGNAPMLRIKLENLGTNPGS